MTNNTNPFVIKHKKSSATVTTATTEDNSMTLPKLPTSEQLDYGEIAINYSTNHETISLKNSSGQIITFKNKVDETYQTVTYPNELTNTQNINAGDEYSAAFKKVENTVNALATEVINNEETVASAISKITDAVGGIVTENGAITYTPSTNAIYIKDATSIDNATFILDSKMKKIEEKFEGYVDTNSLYGNKINVSSEEYQEVSYDESLKDAEKISQSDTIAEALGKIEKTISLLISEVMIASQAITTLAKAMGTYDESDENNIKWTIPTEGAINGATSMQDALLKLNSKLIEMSNS